MKFLCAHCDRLVEMERFALDGSSLVVMCAACGGENRATSAVPPPGASPGVVPAALAPVSAPPAAPAPAPAAPLTSAAPGSVVALRTPTVEAIARAAASAQNKPFDVPAGHCPKCISKRASEALACPSCGLTFSTAAPESFTPSEWLQEQWLLLLGGWGEDAKHEALRAEAMNKDELAPLGRLYRLRLADFPGDPYAARGRDEVLRLAVLPHATARQLKVDPQQPAMWKYVAVSAVIVGCLVVLFYLVRQMLASS